MAGGVTGVITCFVGGVLTAGFAGLVGGVLFGVVSRLGGGGICLDGGERLPGVKSGCWVRG